MDGPDFHGIYRKYSQDVYRFILFLSKSPRLADEITQDVFSQIWISRQPIREGTLKGYLLTIARNRYRAELRRTPTSIGVDLNVTDQSPSVETVIGGKEELQRVLDILQTFPEIDRAALLMHVQDGLPYAAVAVALGLSVVSVKVRVHRTRLKLKSLLASQGAQE